MDVIHSVRSITGHPQCTQRQQFNPSQHPPVVRTKQASQDSNNGRNLLSLTKGTGQDKQKKKKKTPASSTASLRTTDICAPWSFRPDLGRLPFVRRVQFAPAAVSLRRTRAGARTLPFTGRLLEVCPQYRGVGSHLGTES